MNFAKRHTQNSPLLLCNVWDVKSAQIAQQLNFKAIGTSSSAIASMLGFKDGEEISFNELKYIVNRIIQTVNLPLTVDLEAGYSRDALEVADNIKTLIDMGVVGINIEDSLVKNGRELIDAKTFSSFLKAVNAKLGSLKKSIFINVRTDTFLLNHPNAVNETIERANEYQQVGADGIFVPCIENTNDIETIVANTELPLNVMCMPNLPSFKSLKSIGVKRISMGGFVYNKMIKQMEQELQNVITEQSFNNLFL